MPSTYHCGSAARKDSCTSVESATGFPYVVRVMCELPEDAEVDPVDPH